MDGVFSDSVFAWGQYFDYRREHFAAARIPLTYADFTNEWGTAHVPGISNDFSQVEYLRELRSRLHARGKLLMTNGDKTTPASKTRTGETRVFDGFLSDVIANQATLAQLVGDEAIWAFSHEMAYRKPNVTSTAQEWNGVNAWDDEADVARFFKRGLLYGFAPASTTMTQAQQAAPDALLPPDAYAGMPPLEVEYGQRYIPVLRQLLVAGWQPLIGVRASSDAVRVERYGDGHDVHLVVASETGADAVSFTVDRRLLPRVDGCRVSCLLADGVDSAELVRALAGGATVDLPPGAIAVLRLVPRARRRRPHNRDGRVRPDRQTGGEP